MTNIQSKVEGNKLILEIDLTEDHGPSSSGKTTTVASSHGFRSVAGFEDVSFSVNVTKRK